MAEAARNFLSDDKIALLKRTICDGASDDELELFVAQCRRTGLDPFVRQIHAVKRWDRQTDRNLMTIQVGIDGLRLIAERTGNYAPGQDTEYLYDKAGGLIKATAYVKKWVHGEWHVVPGSALWAEYCQTKKDGAPMAMWAKLPHVMLEKCAEARALRRAFPQETSGLYIHEEMAQADSEPPVPRAQAPANPFPPQRQATQPQGARTPQGNSRPAPQQANSRPSQGQDMHPACASCSKAMTAGQATLSQRNYGETLCPTCQRNQQKPTAAPAPANGPAEDDDFEDILGPAAGANDDPFADPASLIDMPGGVGAPGHGD
jgi:phage recombination protein Bet